VTEKISETTISFYKMVSNCIFIVVVIMQILLCWYNYHLCKERQYILKVVSKAVVYDGWDAFSSDRPRMLAQLHSPSEFRVLGIYSGIDSGGIKLKLPDGRIAYTHIFDEDTDIELYKSTDIVSVVVFFTLLISCVFLIVFLYKDRSLSSKFIFVCFLLIYSIGVTALLSDGFL